MRIPFANRTADVDFPAVPGQLKVTIKTVIGSFREHVSSNFEFVFLPPRAEGTSYLS